MRPGEVIALPGEITLNPRAASRRIEIQHQGDRPIVIGSHTPLELANPALFFDRGQAIGVRLDIVAGTSVRFEPGQTSEVSVIPVSRR